MKSIHYTKNIWIWVLILILSASRTTNAQDTISLQQAFQLALKNNLQIKQAKLAEALSSENLKQSKFALYPSLNGTNDLTFSHGPRINPLTNNMEGAKQVANTINVSSSLPLFQGFQRINRIAQNNYLLEADKSYIQKAKNDLILDVLNTYLQVLAYQDLLSAAKQQLDYSNQQLDREQKFFDVGNKTLADLSQAKSQVATSELNVTDAQNKLDLAFLTLAQFLERNPEQSFSVQKPSLESKQINTKIYSAFDIYQAALSKFPEIKQAENQRMARYKEIAIAKGSRYPQITLQGDLRTIYSDVGNTTFANGMPLIQPASSFFDQTKQTFSQMVTIRLAVPIFNGFTTRSSIRTAKVKYESAELSEQLAKNNLNKVINQAVLDVRAAEKKFKSSQAAHHASKDAFNVIEKRYYVGLVNSLDYNQSQTNLNKAQFDVIQAEYDLMFRRKAIDFYLGTCLVDNGCE